jgi:hypothetical protein
MLLHFLGASKGSEDVKDMLSVAEARRKKDNDAEE